LGAARHQQMKLAVQPQDRRKIVSSYGVLEVCDIDGQQLQIKRVYQLRRPMGAPTGSAGRSASSSASPPPVPATAIARAASGGPGASSA